MYSTIIAIVVVIILIFALIAVIKRNDFKQSFLKRFNFLRGGDNKKFVLCGDIHGNVSQFNEMIKHINEGRTAIFMGDLIQEHNNKKVNMTDFSEMVYNLIKNGKLIWVCGNHDLLQYYVNKTLAKYFKSTGYYPKTYEEVVALRIISEKYPKKYRRAVEWAIQFRDEQKWFMKCFEDKLVKFKLLIDKSGKIVQEEDSNIDIIEEYFNGELSYDELVSSTYMDRNDVNCFSHWVINNSTPIKTTEEFYKLIEYVDTKHFNLWYKIYENIWTREDNQNLRIYPNHYVGHSSIIMMNGDFIDKLSIVDRLKVEAVTYSLFVAKKWPEDNLQKYLRNSLVKDEEFYKKYLEECDYTKLVDEITDIGFYKMENIHLCDVQPDTYDIASISCDFIEQFLPTTMSKVFLLDFQ